jgi:hypothetical protein
MNKKNLTTQMNNSANRLTIKDLPAEMVEMSDEALSQVWGARLCPGWWDMPNKNGTYCIPYEPLPEGY